MPSRLVRRYFDLNVNGTNAEATDFPAFVDQAIGVPRAKFKLFISCVETFFDALESIGTNFDLAYSMFVYLLETLSKDGDTFTPQWSDYNRRTGDKLDAVFGRLDPADASEIKTILLDDSQLKLTQRFVDGISTLIEDSFFLAESEGRTNVVPRSQLREMLRNAYKTRSGYVHELRAVHQSLRDAGFNNGGLSDVFVWDNEPFLTLSGLIRLTHHVLRTYLRRQTQSSKEDYPGWRHELPGRITVKMAPQYWIWRHEGLSGENANSRFNGIVVHFCGAFQNAGSAITDLRNLITKIEEILGQTKPEHRHSLLGIYVLWNTVIVESAKSQQRDSVYARYSDQLSECTIQTFAVSVMLSETPVNWDGQDCARCLDDYERHRFKSGRVSLPRQLEIALAVETANRFCDAGDSDNFRKWMRHAMMDAGGLKEVQSEIQGAMDSVQRISTRSIMGFAVPQPDPPID